MLEWLEHGYALPVRSPRRCRIPNKPCSEEDSLFLQQQIQQYLQLDVVEEVSLSKVTCLCPIFVVRGKKPRMIHDLRFVNKFLTAPQIKLEGISTLSQLLRPGDWMVKSDIKSGYHHITIAPESRRFLAFEFQGTIYRWKVLPFGLATAPYVFVKVLRPMLQVLREHNVRCNLYMDDWLVVAESEDLLLQHQRLLWQLSHEMGWALAPDKSVTTPTQQLEYLGFILDTRAAPVLRIPQSKRNELRHSISQLVFHRDRSFTKRRLSQIIGSCVHLTRAWLPAKLLLNSCYRLLNTAPDWNSPLYLTDQVAEDLLWWFNSLKEWDGGQLLDPLPPQISIDTDASPTGWGAILRTQQTSEPLQAAGHWTKELSRSSNNLRELTAVHMALLAFLPQLPDNVSIRINSDNTTTVAYLNKFGGRYQSLDEESRDLYALASQHNWTLSARHVPGVENVLPDQLSRRLDRSDWQLNPALFDLANQLWGPHTVDRFATSVNKLLPRFNSALPQPGAEAVDAFTQSWSDENNWINPPWRLISRVLNKIRRDRAQATLVLPVWTAQPWWPLLTKMLTAPPIPLGRVQGTFLPSLPTAELPEPSRYPHWRAALFRVDGLCVLHLPECRQFTLRSLSTPCLTSSVLWACATSNSCLREALSRCLHLLEWC